MRRFCLLCVLLLAAQVVACAEPVTYTLSTAFSPLSVTGTITTDGTLGNLSASNIIGWDLLINANPAPDGFTPAEFTPSDSAPFVYGDPNTNASPLTATASGLFFNYDFVNTFSCCGGTSLPGGAFLFETSDVNTFLCFEGLGFPCIAYPSGLQFSQSVYDGIYFEGSNSVIDYLSGTKEIASAATPEPSCALLLGTGMLSLIALFRWQRIYSDSWTSRNHSV